MHLIDFTKFANIVDGTRRSSESFYTGTNAATGSSLWQTPVATSQDVEDAVVAARKAFGSWAAKTYKDRTELLERFADIFLAHANQFIELLGAETGRSYEISEKRQEDETKYTIVRYEPLGVVAAICPWNSIGKIAPAIATGNCVIVKPSPFAPYTALKLVELAQQVFPPGVVQALGGDDHLGPQLVRHPGIQKISFTGSTIAGKKIMEACAGTVKRLTLEMAGNNPSLVLPDVDIEKTAPLIAAGLWFNAGQICLASRRLYIHETIYESFVDALARATNSAAKDVVANVGPVQNYMQLKKLQALFEDIRKRGYKIRTEQAGIRDGEGFYAFPTIVDNPPPDSTIVKEEHFGPVIPCIPFSDVDEAIRLANNTESGLAASIWTNQMELAEDIARRLEAGNIFINGPPQPDPFVPFGGHKQSGIGVEYGLEGLLSYCQIKSIYKYQ
ncbi:succinate semialdehyde dehydrogenase [Trichoderma reesei QM6a]|uniref:aldehyde dehydrogenase (NAD(+)) n=2 Tax=Hypocrea jecorina TaxID=51453 RepID=G0RFV8_HYPJQ|nr:succinate semialdehyde dehydrogenase [Trichoderma reesei QM6a]EGR49696.1 succinate semialdehyde dehydrogenase [Trichoderma reesei QM6a]ETS03182.1 aldehyde dehydrogenase [Trichoderma reesei RUT C-30]